MAMQRLESGGRCTVTAATRGKLTPWLSHCRLRRRSALHDVWYWANWSLQKALCSLSDAVAGTMAVMLYEVNLIR
ncbi:hypothetical protein VTN96DRAFT_10002 [Rasamsonia emersonii]